MTTNTNELEYNLEEGLPKDWLTAPKNADAGYDLRADLRKMHNTATIAIDPQEQECFDVGVSIAIPQGYVGLVKGRSSLNGWGAFALNGVIDSGYTGPLKVMLYNSRRRVGPFLIRDDIFFVEHGDKIAQLLIVPVFTLPLKLVDALTETPRGDKGFGSTGRS